MKIIIQKIKDVYELRKYGKEIKAKESSFSRIAALKDLLIKKVDGYDKKIAELDKVYSKALLEYETKYREYKDMRASDVKYIESEHAKLNPYEEAVSKAKQDLDDAKDYRKKAIVDITGELSLEHKTYLTAQADKITKEAYKAKLLKQRFLETLKGVSESYGEVADLERLMKLYLNDIGLSYEMKLGKTISQMTRQAPLSKQDISLDTSAVLSAIR